MDLNPPPGENYANPRICFFHVLFKAGALAFYILSALFFDSFVIIFVVTVLLAALDFWVVKNVSGRILVGLRWWNEIDDNGESVWKFECLDQESLARMNKKDSWLFWWTLYLTAVVWLFFGIFSLIRFQADYLLVVGVCLTLSVANIVGFTKCRKDAKKNIQQGTKVTGSTFDGSGTRHGAVELLHKANPENLRVVVHAIVDRIIFSKSELLGVVAVGVVYHDLKGKHQEVRVRRNGEVILSAGAIGSPQLLLVSGIGHGSYLESQNISVVYQHPFVGQFMADNPRTQISLLVPFPLDDVGARVVGITNDGTYIESTSGVTPFDSRASFIFFPTTNPPLNLSVISIVGKITRPSSIGYLSLKHPNDVTVTPKVRFNYYSNSEDLVQCANAVHTIGKMLKTSAMELYKFTNLDGERYFKFVGHSLPQDLSNEESVKTFCRKTLTTFYHFHGGCLVNKVVDSELKVIGIKALRVVDSSVFSHSPGTNPQATIMMLGRYIGKQIVNARRLEDIIISSG